MQDCVYRFISLDIILIVCSHKILLFSSNYLLVIDRNNLDNISTILLAIQKKIIILIIMVLVALFFFKNSATIIPIICRYPPACGQSSYSRLPSTQFNKCTFCITLTNCAFSKCEFECDWPYPDVTKKYVSVFDSTWQCKQKWHALQKKMWPKTWITLGIVEMKWTVSLCMLINVYWKNNSILHAQMEFQRVNVMLIP